MPHSRMPTLATVAAAVLLAVSSVAAQAQSAIEVGVLECKVSGGAGFVIGSTKRLECVFKSGPRREFYTGRIDKFGLDLGITNKGVIGWAVLAPTEDAAYPGALAGNYAGVSGEATVGVGVSANALVGGSKRTITLQPLSVGAQEGLNFALGIAALALEPAG